MSNTTNWNFDPAGQVTSIVRPGGLITAFSYDVNGRPLDTVQGADNVWAPSAGLVDANGGSNVRTTSGWSKPYSWRMNAISFAVASRPASRRAGSPFGIDSNSRNVSTEITNMTPIIAISRRTTNLAISYRAIRTFARSCFRRKRRQARLRATVR